MQLKYQYFYFNNVFDKETCDKIIETGTTRISDERSKGKDVSGYTHGDGQKNAKPDAAPQGEHTKQELKKQGIDPDETYVRDSDVTWINDSWIYDIVLPKVAEANFRAGWNFQWDYSESFQFTVYKPGGFYSWHKDGGGDHYSKYKRYIYGVTPEPLKPDGRLPERYVTDPNMVGKVRKLSVTINLSPPGSYEGGNLKFDYGQHSEGDRFHECEEIRPQGSMIVFPSFIDHTVTPITKGTRYSLVLWNLGEPFK